jgi:hypothetical protein
MRTLVSTTLLGFCLAATNAPAAEPAAEPQRELLQPPKVEIASPLTDRFALKGIYSLGKVSTEVRYDQAPGVLGTNFYAEDLLGLEDKSHVGGLEMMIRMGQRNRLRVDYFKLARHGDVVLDQRVVIGDNTYLLTDRLVTSVDLRMLGLTYTYSFLKTERFELGGGLGLHLGQGEGVGEVPARRVRDNFDGVAPLPTLVLDGSWRISRRFSFNGRVQYLTVHTQGIDGTFGNYHADLQYRWRKNLALGLGYSKLQILVNSADPGNTGRLDFQVKGPEAFLRASF